MSIPSDLLNQPSRFSWVASNPSLRARLLPWVPLPLCIDSPRCHQWTWWESALYPRVAMAWVWCLMLINTILSWENNIGTCHLLSRAFLWDVEMSDDFKHLVPRSQKWVVQRRNNQLSELHITAKEEDTALKNVGLILSCMFRSFPKLFGICVSDYRGWMIVIKQLWLFLSLIPLSMSFHKEVNVT